MPIPTTIESIKGFPDKLVIFKVPASPFWWMRYYDGKPIKRSSKTTDKKKAIAAAKKFYEDLVVNKRLGISSNPRVTSFMKCAEEVIANDEQKVLQGELTASYVTNQKHIIRGHIADYLGKHDLADIDYAMLDAFKTYLFGKNLAPASIKINFVFVKKILDHALRTNVIRTSLILPKVKADDNARGYFTAREYWQLCRMARKLRGETSALMQRTGGTDAAPELKKLRNIPVTDEISVLIPFMVYTFWRPTDIKNVKHRHIEIKTGKDGRYLWMPIPASKAHSKPMTSLPRAAIFYDRIRAKRLAEIKGTDAVIDDEYVFMPAHKNRDYALRQIARQFDVILEAAQLRLSAEGDVRTLYSLRHTSLMFRFIYGGNIDSLKLANNARTSVDMLERFYLAQLESSQLTEDLHRKKPVKPKKAARPPTKGERIVYVTVPEGADAHLNAPHTGTTISSTDPIKLDLTGIAKDAKPE